MIGIDDQYLLENFDRTVEGILYHASDTRQCLINGEKIDFINSGDLIKITKGKIYLKRRTNRTIKINGILTNLENIDLVCDKFYLLNFNQKYIFWCN